MGFCVVYHLLRFFARKTVIIHNATQPQPRSAGFSLGLACFSLQQALKFLGLFVAQICNPYRRFVIGGTSDSSVRAGRFGSPAECNSAIKQIANLRYKKVGSGGFSAG
jgi:hypothetical protein